MQTSSEESVALTQVRILFWSSRVSAGRCGCCTLLLHGLQGSQLTVTVPVARGGVAALLREAEPVRDSLLQATQEPVTDKVMLVVKQSAGLL
jgi:hypothetical protein